LTLLLILALMSEPIIMRRVYRSVFRKATKSALLLHVLHFLFGLFR